MVQITGTMTNLTLFFTRLTGSENNFRTSLILGVTRFLMKIIVSPHINRQDTIEQGSANLFGKGPDIINILGFVVIWSLSQLLNSAVVAQKQIYVYLCKIYINKHVYLCK